MNYRVASVISNYFYAIAVVLIIAAAFGGFWLHRTYQGPRYETVDGTRVVYTYQGRFLHEAYKPAPGFADQNTSSYPLADVPRLKVGFVFSISGSDYSQGILEIDSDLVVSWRDEDQVIWSESMDKAENVYALNNNFARLNYVLNVSDLYDRAQRARENLQLEGGSLRVKVVNDVSLDGEIDRRDVEETETYQMSIEFGETNYTIGTNLTSKKNVTEQYTKLVKRKIPLSEKLPPLVLLVAPLIVLGLVANEWRKLDERDLERLKEEHERGKYEEWISRGKLPELHVRDEIEIESLEDLVDVAVDSESRVIYDEDKSTYYMIHEGVLYFYQGTR